MMSHRFQKLSQNRKSTDLSLQLNMNACDQTQTNLTSHLESIGTSIIDELKGSERDHLKQRLLTSNLNSKLPFSSSSRSLKQVLADFHTFDCHTQREYRTVGSGDNDVNTISSMTDIVTNNESQLMTAAKHETSFFNSSRTSRNENKKIPNTITRTIVTRSSKLNSLNINPEPINHVPSNRARTRRSINTNAQSDINTMNNTTEKAQLDLHKTVGLGEGVSGVKVSRKKLQPSLATPVDSSATSDDF